MIKAPEKSLIVTPPVRKRNRSGSRRKAWVSMLAGVGLATAWHFIHQAGEAYQPTPAELSFWFHLFSENILACYLALLCSIVWTVIERLKKRMRIEN